MKTFHLQIKTKRDFEKIVNGKILVYPIENKVNDYLRGQGFSNIKIWHGPEKKKECITRVWAGTTICDGACGQQYGIVVNIVRCENCTDGTTCTSAPGSSNIVLRKDNKVACVRMSQFVPILNQG